MYGIIKQLSVLGLSAALAATLSARTALAQETGTRDTTVQAQPGDTGEMRTPPGYQGVQRSGDSALAGDSALSDTSAVGDSLGLGDTTDSGTSRLRPTDSTGTAAPSSGDETADSTLAGDSASVHPGDSSSVRPSTPQNRLEPTDSSGAANPTQGP